MSVEESLAMKALFPPTLFTREVCFFERLPETYPDGVPPEIAARMVWVMRQMDQEIRTQNRTIERLRAQDD